MNGIALQANVLSEDTKVSSGWFKNKETAWVIIMIALYVIANITYAFMSNATWDDDCPSRYYNTLDAFNNPRHFIELWNRPLFVLLFCIPVQLSKHTIPVVMVLITAFSTFTLFKALKELKIENAFMVIPFLLFQAFFLGMSRNAETEPLAVAIICLATLFYARKQFVAFALIGSLLPLARLELSLLLIVWAIILVREKQYKLIPLLGVGAFAWNLVGAIADGDPLWLLHKAMGDKKNMYGHQTFGHYFQRYIYVLGPVVFYYFFIGLIDRIGSKKKDLFITIQFILGFMIYVLFGWKLSMGDSAGFLRNLIPLSPLAAIIAVYGYNRWINSLGKKKTIETKPLPVEVVADNEPVKTDATNKYYRQKTVQTVAQRKEALRQKALQEKQLQEEKKKAADEINQASRNKVFVLSCSLIAIILSWFFFSKELVSHHKLTENKDYTNILVISAIVVLYIVLLTGLKNRVLSKTFKVIAAAVIFLSCMGFTMITEPWDSHMNSERETMNKISNLFVNSHLKNNHALVNHIWFYWANELDKYDKDKFKVLTRENLKKAPVSTVVVWETHYSNRLAGNVPLDSLVKNPEFIEIYRVLSPDKKFMSVMFQKVKKDGSDINEKFTAMINALPEEASVYVSRGNYRINRLKDFKGSIEDYSTAIKKDSTVIDGYFNRGLAYFNKNEFKKAVADFKKVSELKPDNADAFFNIGAASANMGDEKAAIENYTKSIAINGKNVNTYLNRGIVYNVLKDAPKAIADFSKVIELNPNHLQALMNRGSLYASQSNFQSALADFTRMVQIEPKNAIAHFNQGVCYMRLNKKSEACTSLFQSRSLGYGPAQTLIGQYCMQ